MNHCILRTNIKRNVWQENLYFDLGTETLKFYVLIELQPSTGTTLIGQTGPSAAERAAEASKRGHVNVSTPDPCTAERTVRRLGRHLRKFIAIRNPVQVRL